MSLNNITTRLLTILILSFLTLSAAAQLSKQNLTGKYSMNHDGWEGTLVIEQTKRDCNSSPWCDLSIHYIDSDNKTHRARIRRISKDWQHITFIIRFSDHLQLFQGHFFSREKNVMAGTTTWRNETFGFYARKKQEITLDWRNLLKRGNFESIYELRRKIAEEGGEEENRIVNRRINEDGRVEIRYQNGRKEIYYERGGIMVITPENDTIRPQIPLMAVMNLVPPIPDEPEIDQWFETLNANMDSIVDHLVDDEESFNNYKESLSEYSSAERVNKAMRMIDFLIIE